MIDGDLERARTLIERATRILVLTGAGISTSSGIPDFRGPEGIWTKDPDAEMLSNYEVWLTNAAVRQRAWASRLAHRDVIYEPNAGHRSLVELERRGQMLLLVTQNIDGLHHRAGSSPELIIEIHGSGREAVCQRCGHRQPIAEALDRVAAGESDPHCLELRHGSPCGGILKSATISFGQSLVAADLARSELAAEQCDLVLAVGSTLAVYPAANLVPLAHQRGARVVIVNGSPTVMDQLADVTISGDINERLPALLSN